MVLQQPIVAIDSINMVIALCVLLVICLASCQPSGDFLPKYMPENGNCYQYALKVYSSSPRPGQGVYECGDTIFVVVVLDASSIDKRHLEGKAMLRSIALLRERMPDLPPKFTTGSRLVEKSMDDEKLIYRYAIAYRKSALQDIIKAAKEQEKQSRKTEKTKIGSSKADALEGGAKTEPTAVSTQQPSKTLQKTDYGGFIDAQVLMDLEE